ncbi:hypothetical protein VTI28DRAFT_9648 [Corynascus sepedonium]
MGALRCWSRTCQSSCAYRTHAPRDHAAHGLVRQKSNQQPTIHMQLLENVPVGRMRYPAAPNPLSKTGYPPLHAIEPTARSSCQLSVAISGG